MIRAGTLAQRIEALEKQDPRRLYVRVSISRNGECQTPAHEAQPPDAELCVTVEINRTVNALALQKLNGAPQSENEAHAAAQQDANRTASPATGEAEGARGSDAEALDGPAAHPDAARAPAPVCAPDEGSADVVLGGRAKDAVLETRRVSVPLGAPPPQLGPEDVVGGPEPHGDCAIPWCGHPLRAHRCFTERLPCRHCGWPVGFHDGLAVGLDPLPYAARRLWPCAVYLSIAFEGGEQDGCSEAGCTCPGWRRTAPYVSPRQDAIRALREEQERALARGRRELEETRAQCEQLRADALRAQGLTDNGPSPHGCPVYSEGEDT